MPTVRALALVRLVPALRLSHVALVNVTAAWLHWAISRAMMRCSDPLRYPASGWPRHDVHALHAAWPADAAAASAMAAVLADLRTPAVASPVRLLYDPALCARLPAWLHAAGGNTHVVVAVSDPSEVQARALAWRPGPDAAAAALTAWTACMEHAHAACAASPQACTRVPIPRRPAADVDLARVLHTAVRNVADAVAATIGHTPSALAHVRAQLLGPAAVTAARPLLLPSLQRLQRLASTFGALAYPNAPPPPVPPAAAALY